jgi:hypothetical protein
VLPKSEQFIGNFTRIDFVVDAILQLPSSTSVSRFEHLPYIFYGFSRNSRSQTGFTKLIWMDDVLDHDPNQEEIAKLCRDQEILANLIV